MVVAKEWKATVDMDGEEKSRNHMASLVKTTGRWCAWTSKEMVGEKLGGEMYQVEIVESVVEVQKREE